MENFFTPDNWNSCRYQYRDQFAFISLMAEPSEDLAQLGELMYCVTVLDEEHNEIFQQGHPSLMEACQSINATYGGIWDFKDLRFKENEGGCSSCQAH